MFDKNYDGVNHALEDKCENPWAHVKLQM
jgi:hypothetical protein